MFLGINIQVVTLITIIPKVLDDGLLMDNITFMGMSWGDYTQIYTIITMNNISISEICNIAVQFRRDTLSK